jgi:hypothetical protein
MSDLQQGIIAFAIIIAVNPTRAEVQVALGHL